MVAAALVSAMVVGLAGLVWVSRHVLIWRQQRRQTVLSPDSPGPPADPPLISVLVAARDEEACIETCIRTMLAQDYPSFELIVCNDRSSDATARIAEGIAREDGRLRLVNIDHLPDGWCGKNHAMQHGIAESRGEWICMIDADCRQTSNRTLSAAMQYALDTGADLLSVLPQLEMRTFWENVVQPVCGGVMMIWFRPDRVNDPASSTAYANGAFMLIRRSAYQAIGTHEAVRTFVNEDMHMARLVKRKGLNLRVVSNRGLYLARMYTSLRRIVAGWGRIFYGTFGTLRRLTVSLLVILVMGLPPYLAVGAGLALAAAGVQPAWAWRLLALTGLAVAAVQISAIYRFYRLIGARSGLAWTYPLGCVVAAIALIKALAKLRPGASVVWKDTTYSSRDAAVRRDS